VVEGKRPTRRGFDLLIAATAIEHGLTLVTRNVRDYADIRGLQLYQGAPSG
jgi:predicted nucleic acid-binding protein